MTKNSKTMSKATQSPFEESASSLREGELHREPKRKRRASGRVEQGKASPVGLTQPTRAVAAEPSSHINSDGRSGYSAASALTGATGGGGEPAVCCAAAAAAAAAWAAAFAFATAWR